MADVAVVLDTASLTGLQAGKKGQKKAGGGAVQADFVLALISQISAGDVAKGQSLKLASGAADIDASGAGRSVRADQLIAASQQGEKAPAVAFSDEAVTADGAEGGHVAEAATSASTELASPILQPPVAAALAPATPSTSPSVPDAKPLSSPSTPLAVAVQAVSAKLSREASASSADQLDTPDSTVPRSLLGGEVKAGNSSGASAIAADGGGKNGQALPAFDADMSNNDPGAFQDQSGDMASATTLAAGSSVTLSSPEATMARPFDQVLRQMETRLNVSVEAHVKSPSFANELGEKVVWLAGRNGQVAELTLNPPQMGSVEIRLTVAGGEAGAQFFSANPVVREALETALPKLRELMAQAGINLGEANVRDQSFAQGKGSERPEAGASALFPAAEAANEGMGIGLPRSGGLGLVDLYA